MLLPLLLIFVFSNAGCSPQQKKTQIVGIGNNLGEIFRSDYLKVIHEPSLNEFKEPYVYRLWYSRRGKHLTLTLTCTEKNKMEAHFYEWYGSNETFKTWKHELNNQQTEQVLELLNDANLWNVSETAYVNSLVTDGTMYDIEFKEKNKYRELYANMTGNFDCASTCKTLCQKLFQMCGAEI